MFLIPLSGRSLGHLRRQKTRRRRGTEAIRELRVGYTRGGDPVRHFHRSHSGRDRSVHRHPTPAARLLHGDVEETVTRIGRREGDAEQDRSADGGA